MQKILRDYCEQLHTKKLDNIYEMDKFLNKYNLTKLIQKEIEYQNIWIACII